MYVNTWDLEPHGHPFIRGWLSIFGWFWNSLLNRECLDFTIPIHFKKVGFRYQDLDEFLDGVSLMWSWYTCPKDPLWPYNWSEWTCFFTVWGSGIPDVRHCFPALNWDAENKDSQMLNVIMQSIFTYMWIKLMINAVRYSKHGASSIYSWCSATPFWFLVISLSQW